MINLAVCKIFFGLLNTWILLFFFSLFRAGSPDVVAFFFFLFGNTVFKKIGPPVRHRLYDHIKAMNLLFIISKKKKKERKKKEGLLQNVRLKGIAISVCIQ